MVAASTYLWSNMTAAQGLGFGPTDVVSFDNGGGAGQVGVAIGPTLTTLAMGGKSLQFLDTAMSGDPGQFQFADGSHLGVDGQSGGGTTTFVGGGGADQYQAQNQPADGTWTDIVFGGGGADVIGGGDGNDMLFAGATASSAGDGLPGAAFINGQLGDDSIVGGGGADTLFGGQGSDTLFGNGGDDSVNGNLGGDSMSGGAGADSMFGGQDNDTLDGGDGNDSLSGDLGDELGPTEILLHQSADQRGAALLVAGLRAAVAIGGDEGGERGLSAED